MSKSIPHAGAATSALVLALLSGCATQDAVTEKTEPIMARVDKLDKALQANNGSNTLTQEELAAARARDAALATRVDGMIADMKALRDQVAAQARADGQVNDRLSAAAEQLRVDARQVETRLADLANLARELANRVNAQALSTQSAATVAATTSERLAGVEGRLDGLSRQMTVAADQASLLRRDLDNAAALAAGLPARMARLEGRMDELARLARSAMEMAAQNDIRSNGKVAFSALLTEDKTLYPMNLQYLGAKDRAVLDDLVKRVKEMNKDYHLEIQGHTDNTSVDDYNYQLGKARAEVVKRYLHEQGGIPLGWMSVISYGATQPLDPKSNGNRRIVIQALVLDPDK
jgi:outer membrane protein OmpA-like peptidoglycan-associated protein